ncbi:AAA family ATPase [Fusobacterium polymorphum]|uniref:Transporter n=1 Tax=Fusobacterium nucleatum subsp. polymorphum TaxID=76857 RepID=A0A2C6BW77_FUSNP|nr:ATP/GTP-binding protein [Fusobacterium polymorphum]PHI08453.1 transporter [Fusobacterium polymorphum]
MFTYIKLKNYKSLIELEVDLTKKENTPKKLISIYGENGIGKSNFVDSFYTLKKIVSTRTINEKIRILTEKQKELQTDDFNKALYFFGQLGSIIKNGFFSNSIDIINECKTIDSKDNMIIEVGFKIKSKSGIYCIETDNTDIISEKLDFTLNKNKVNFFEITKKEKYLNESVFIDNEYKKEILSIIEKYWGKHSLLSLIAYEIEDKKENYVKKKIFNGIFEVINFFSSLSILSRNKLEVFKDIEEEKLFYGTISANEEKKLINIENVINTFFTALFSDIKQAYYKKKVDRDEINYILCFKKNIYNKLIDIEYNRESTGTKNILKILPYLISAAKGKTVIIDEIDNGIHDLLILKILENLSEDLKGQLIITTHNTLLLEEEFIKDSIYIFKVDENANKKLLSLNKFEGRIHPNLSIRKRYLKGLYGGIPFPMDIDFNELIEGM